VGAQPRRSVPLGDGWGRRVTTDPRDALQVTLILMFLGLLGGAFSLSAVRSGHRAWTWWLTGGLLSEGRERKRGDAEDYADNFVKDHVSQGYKPPEIAVRLLVDILIGLPADLSWRRGPEARGWEKPRGPSIIERIRARWAARRQGSSISIVHGDLHLKNILITGNHDVRFTIIDVTPAEPVDLEALAAEQGISLHDLKIRIFEDSDSLRDDSQEEQ
jgi:hypothetical protein